MNCIKDDWPFSVSDIQEEVLLSIFLDIRTKNLLCSNEQITWTQQPKVQKSLGGHSVFVVISLTVLKTCKEQKSPFPFYQLINPLSFSPGVWPRGQLWVKTVQCIQRERFWCQDSHLRQKSLELHSSHFSASPLKVLSWVVILSIRLWIFLSIDGWFIKYLVPTTYTTYLFRLPNFRMASKSWPDKNKISAL